MDTDIHWPDILIRLGYSLVACAIIGANRGEHGRPAGLRTTVLVGLTATASMIMANLLLDTTGRAPDSFTAMDVMRLPLGVLTGVGFIGAGAILHKGDLVIGVTTAATLWFTTMMGFCFGAGEVGLGFTLLGLSVLVLWGFEWIEGHIRRTHTAIFRIATSANGPNRRDILSRLERDHYEISSVSVRCGEGVEEYRIEVRWRAGNQEIPPAYVTELAAIPGVRETEWAPILN